MSELTTLSQSPEAMFLMAALGIQLALAIYTAISMKSTLKEQHLLLKETFGVMKKIEGLTAHRREIFMRQYEKLMENLAARLPTTISAQASEAIFEAESKILKRLAEIEPNFKNDEAAQSKMDDLIGSMERLDRTIVTLTSDTVRKVMLESREELLDEPALKDDTLGH